MKCFTVICVAGLFFFSSVAFGELLWFRPDNLRMSWGSVDVVTTAQFYCDQLKNKHRKDWRLPTESELLNQGPRNVKGIFWSANGVPFRVKGEALVIAVDLEHTAHLFVGLHSKQLVTCVHDQF